MQKVTFYVAICRLSQRERLLFITQNAAFQPAKDNLLQAKQAVLSLKLLLIPVVINVTY